MSGLEVVFLMLLDCMIENGVKEGSSVTSAQQCVEWSGSYRSIIGLNGSVAEKVRSGRDARAWVMVGYFKINAEDLGVDRLYSTIWKTTLLRFERGPKNWSIRFYNRLVLETVSSTRDPAAIWGYFEMKAEDLEFDRFYSTISKTRLLRRELGSKS